MNPKNLELVNILILLFIMVDYYIKYRKKLDSNSILWIFQCVTTGILAFINIALYYFHDIHVQNLLLFLGNILAIIPMLIYCNYININYIGSHKVEIEKKHMLLYFVIYFIIVTVFFAQKPLAGEAVTYLSEYKNYYIFLMLIVGPSVIIIGKCVFKDIIVKPKIILALLFPVIGGVLDYILKEATYLTLSYTLSALLVYMWKYDSVINRDTLTGAKNRRFFDNYVYSEDKRYAVFMIDADGFKAINDRYGHDTGDIILTDIVEILERSVRTTDSVIRLGGDEFSIISIIKCDNDLKIIIERIEENTRKYNECHNIPISLSYGYGIYYAHDDFTKFLKVIDKKMYKNKKNKKKEK